ncbi:MAG TPA: membrane protein insertase YidC [Streptosporangiaceae bacterium]
MVITAVSSRQPPYLARWRVLTMLSLLNIPVGIAYYIVSALASGLTPLLGGAAAAIAIVVFTIGVRLLVLPLSLSAMRGQAAQARLAPQVAELRQRHARDPQRFQAELNGLYQREGTSLLAGCLPLLLQAPFFSVMYLLFRSPRVGGTANGLLGHHLLGAPLASHWLTVPGPVSWQGAVFLGVFGVLAVIGWLQARLARAPVAAARPAGQPAGAARLLTVLAPAMTVVMAAIVPLAAGLYLVTTTAWTLAERWVLRRRVAVTAPVSPSERPGRGRRTTGQRR